MSAVKKIIQASITGPDTAWDLDYAYYSDLGREVHNAQQTREVTNGDFTVNNEDIVPRGFKFGDNGTKMYVAGDSNNKVFYYDLSTAYDVTTATNVSAKDLDPSTQGTTLDEVALKTDGTAIYIWMDGDDTIYQYDMTTPWDTSTASYSSVSFSLAGTENQGGGLWFNPDGSQFFVVGSHTDTVREYTMATAWDLANATAGDTLSISSQESEPEGIAFTSNGKHMYVTGRNGDSIDHWALSTAWDITSATHKGAFSVNTEESVPHGIEISGDEDFLYIIGTGFDTIFTYAFGGLSVNNDQSNPEGIFFKDDGTKLYVCGTSQDQVVEYHLSTAWDTSTISNAGSPTTYNHSTQETNAGDIFFKPDGTALFLVGTSSDKIHRYDLSTAWDISSSSISFTHSSDTLSTLQPKGMFFKPDGTKVYTTTGTDGKINEYNLSTAWDVTSSSLSLNQSFTRTRTNTCHGVSFKSDGTKMMVVQNGDDVIEAYDLSTAWDVSTATLDKIFSVTRSHPGIKAIYFRDDGEMFFVCGSTRDVVSRYSIGERD